MPDSKFIIVSKDHLIFNNMETVTISPRFKITLPKSIWEKYDLKPGQKLQIFSYQNRIIIIPTKPAEALRGFLKGIDASVKREEDRY